MLLMLQSMAVAFLAGSRVGQPTASVALVSRSPSVSSVLAEPEVEARGAKLYTKKEAPKIAGGVKVGTSRVVVVTGASSGLGLSSTKALCDEGYFVVAAVRDPAKMDRVAKENGIASNRYVAMKLELASLQSVKDFVQVRTSESGGCRPHVWIG